MINNIEFIMQKPHYKTNMVEPPWVVYQSNSGIDEVDVNHSPSIVRFIQV